MDTRQVRQEGKHKTEDSLEVLLHEYSAFQTRYQNLWNMRLRWVAGIATIFASGIVWGFSDLEWGQISTKVVILVLPYVLMFGTGVVVTLELQLRQDGLYLKHIENKVNKVAGPELLQYYKKYSLVLGGMQHRFLGMIPISFMTIIYIVYLIPFCGLWIYIIWLAVTEYIIPIFPIWKRVLFLVLYILSFVVPAFLLLYGFRFTDNKFKSIMMQDRVWYTNSKIKEPEEKKKLTGVEIGIIIFAVLFLIIGILNLIQGADKEGAISYISYLIEDIFIRILGLLLIITSIGLFRKIELARKSIIILCVISSIQILVGSTITGSYELLITYIIIIVGMIIFIPPIIFFSNSKIKEQFKK